MDGHLNKCKECTKCDTKRNYKNNLDYYRNYDKSRAKLKHRVDAKKEYSLTSAGKKSKKKASIKYRDKYPKAYKSKIAYGNALRRGDIIRDSKCEECQSEKRIEGHHDDYDHPLIVRWLCCTCHNKWHRCNTPLNRF